MFLVLAAAAAAGAAGAVTVPPAPQLKQQIEVADRELFDLFFVQPCDQKRFRAMLTDDVEFYHDKDGFNMKSADDFMKAYTENCTRRADPTTWRSRRELVPASLRIDPVPGYGAMEVGDHLFYERHGAQGAEKLVGKASFAMVWVLGADGKWRVSRVLSSAHAAAQ
jgi:hypothetical protein